MNSTHMDSKRAIETQIIGGIETARVSRAELANVMVVDCLEAKEGRRTQPRVVVSSNGYVIALYHKDPRFRASIDASDIVDADGMPLVFASRLFCNNPLPERVATTDFIHDACRAARDNGISFYFLGAKPGIADRAADALRKIHSGLSIAGVRDGYFSPEQDVDVCRDVINSGADVLWVGLGSPRQEEFAIKNRAALRGLGWIHTCGGLFDHYGGGIPRAPNWMQRWGFEWLHRLAVEPKRLGPRYLTTNPVALYHLVTKTRG